MASICLIAAVVPLPLGCGCHGSCFAPCDGCRRLRQSTELQGCMHFLGTRGGARRRRPKVNHLRLRRFSTLGQTKRHQAVAIRCHRQAWQHRRGRASDQNLEGRVHSQNTGSLQKKTHAVVSFFLSPIGTTNIVHIQHLAVERQMKSTSADNPPIEDRASNLVNDGLVRRPAQDRTRWSLASQVLRSRCEPSSMPVDGTCRS